MFSYNSAGPKAPEPADYNLAGGKSFPVGVVLPALWALNEDRRGSGG